MQYSGVCSQFVGADMNAVVFFSVGAKIVVLRVRFCKGKFGFVVPPV